MRYVRVGFGIFRNLISALTWSTVEYLRRVFEVDIEKLLVNLFEQGLLQG